MRRRGLFALGLDRLRLDQIEQILVLLAQPFNLPSLLNNHLIQLVQHFFMIGQSHLNRHKPLVVGLHIHHFLLVRNCSYVIINSLIYNQKTNAPTIRH